MIENNNKFTKILYGRNVKHTIAVGYLKISHRKCRGRANDREITRITTGGRANKICQ